MTTMPVGNILQLPNAPILQEGMTPQEIESTKLSGAGGKKNGRTARP